MKPNNIRWAFGARTGCGQELFLRPCQGCEHVLADSSVFPLHDICKGAPEKVFIVEDDPDLLEEIAELVSFSGYEVHPCRNADELRAGIAGAQTGCVLLDIGLPGQDGLALQEWIVAAGLNLPVVFISGMNRLDTAVHCMKAGAIDYLRKPFNEIDLRRAINRGISLSRKNHCRQESVKSVKEVVASLTPTELEVARKMAHGLPTKVIAAEMGRSENTIKIHRHKIFGKLLVYSPASVANLLRHIES